MLRSACIFLAAILLPSLVLAWLAVGSARDQQVLIEHQQAIISQDVTDSLAKNVRNQIDDMRSQFVQVTQGLVDKSTSPRIAADGFDRNLRDQWPLAQVGFAVDLEGTIYSPGRNDSSAARTFREEYDRFLTNREDVEVYSSLNSQNLVVHQQESVHQETAEKTVTRTASLPAQDSAYALTPITVPSSVTNTPTFDVPADAIAKPRPNTDIVVEEQAVATTAAATTPPGAASSSRAAMGGSASSAQAAASPSQKDAQSQQATADKIEEHAAPQILAGNTAQPDATADSGNSPAPASPVTDSSKAAREFEGKQSQKLAQMYRNVSPQNTFDVSKAVLSKTVPEESGFKKLIGKDSSGAIARFLDDKLRLLFWYRPVTTSPLVFGAQLDQTLLVAKLNTLLQAPELQERDKISSLYSKPGYCLALLDDTGHPAAVSIPGFVTDWKHPFVATEIGETLPHWEAALYLTDPEQFSKSARTLRLTVGLIVLLLVVAIVAGCSLIAADIRRQVRVARQKTDFVSNVSHELKTPLTSIRMFADLLAEGRVTEPERQATYLKIISAESARLTRLINNVLDFARQERGVSTNERRACDLVETTRDVVETCLPHLEASGQNLICEIEAETLPIVGDRDAIAQIVLNLISNAEKYGGGEILVRIRRQEISTGALGCVDVLDHGPGVPPKQVESIFLPFHRLHDSLSSGIPGSGLGLTLARRMARVHGGDINYTPRAGGGSCFTLSVPLTT